MRVLGGKSCRGEVKIHNLVLEGPSSVPLSGPDSVSYPEFLFGQLPARPDLKSEVYRFVSDRSTEDSSVFHLSSKAILSLLVHGA